MFCPQCSYQQYSNDVRFCQRCGFHLVAVSDLMRTNGLLHQPPRSEQGFTLPKLRNAPVGAKLMFFGIALIPFALIASIAFDSPGPLAAPFILFLIGAIQVLYVWLFGTKSSNRQLEVQRDLVAAQARAFSLPYPETPPLRIEDRREANTSEIIQPSSVTEHTTKLLDRES
jgi:hypothetical protein